MGATLSEPITTKETTFTMNTKLCVGASSMQGWRLSMEDSHTLLPALPEDEGTAYFGVFDGHGGCAVSDYLGKHLFKYISKQREYKLGNIQKAIHQGFLGIDNYMKNSLRNTQSGSTANIILLKDGKLYCANVGDSRAIACVGGSTVALSQDHKPTDPEERRRISAAGGWVESNRVNGNLALSRALGDFNFKLNAAKSPEEQIITAMPDITVKDVNDKWEFLVLACDGIWDVMTNEEVAGFVRSRLKSGVKVDKICEELLDQCISPDGLMGGIGCDNMTAIIVKFNLPES